MFEVKDISIIVQNRYFIKDLSFSLNKKDKLAIIGEEGNGKSTLVKCLLEICDYATLKGTINNKGNTIGYLPQQQENTQKSVFNYLFDSTNAYYNKISDFYKYLNQLNISETLIHQSMSSLSGGESVKIRILKLLLEDYDILFFDEPTNDLDIETLKWLEDFIIKCEKPILYVSHDETLLKKTANMIIHIEQRKKKTQCLCNVAKMDYTSYIETRTNSLENQTRIAGNEKREFEKKEKILNQIKQKVDYQLNTISRSDPHGAKLLKKKMHSIKSQEKKLNQTIITEKPDVEEEIHFFFENEEIPNHKIVLEEKISELKIGEKILSKNIELNISGPSHVCIIGKNGVGKSTLLKAIYEKLKNRKDLKVGYMPQNYEEILNLEENVSDFITNHKASEITKSRMYLGNMNFTKEEMTTKIKNLSNGSIAKLLLIKLVLEECNVLILDEPTRNISPLSNPVIREVLKNFKGTIISISHDRLFINEVMDEIYELTKEGLTKIK
ncbi:MAG: ABC-F family ATP-binding cassette domain-containing protein [Bacilli bacterium]|nr:ABC-F family ATP-binding cassette domain-containing protein [Bacilli bacterium]